MTVGSCSADRGHRIALHLEHLDLGCCYCSDSLFHPQPARFGAAIKYHAGTFHLLCSQCSPGLIDSLLGSLAASAQFAAVSAASQHQDSAEINAASQCVPH